MVVYLHKRQLFIFLILIGAILLIGNQILRNKLDTERKAHSGAQSPKLEINYDLNDKWYLQKCLNNIQKGEMTLEKLDIYLKSFRFSRVDQCK
jgi:hypothetical protein